LAVQRRYHDLTNGTCVIVETNTMTVAGPGVTWQSDTEAATELRTADDGTVKLADVNALWYRRTNMPQRGLNISDRNQRNFVDRSNAAALLGILETSFGGTWISEPTASKRAENKLVQLRAAIRAGMRVPRTLVSQDPEAIRRFYRERGDGGVVMKALTFDPRQPLLTLQVEEHHVEEDAAIRLCPTMFQELIPGDRHLRVLCAGDDVYAITVTADQLDWRPNLDLDAQPVEIDATTVKRMQMVLEILNLRMGVFDLKLAGDLPVFLEVNPQGQFLFMDGMADIDTASAFATFLHREATYDLRRR
jgi:glutathione synthase/RimK-type ligase-like ATP-grasp enzyme